MNYNLDELLHGMYTREKKPSDITNQRILRSVKENKNMNRMESFRKIAMAATIIGVLSLGGVSTYAAAHYLFGYSINIGNKKISTEVETVSCNELKDADISQKYSTIANLEKKLGVDLLESSLAYEYSVPNVEVSKCDISDSLSYTVNVLCYYVHDQELEGDEHLWKSVGNNPFQISYQADLIVKPGDLTGMEESYEEAEFVESYTTKNGIQAEVFMFGNEYNAHIKKDNIIYKFMMESCGQGSVQDLKTFLDSLE